VAGDDTSTTVPEAFVKGLAGTGGSARRSAEWIVPLDTLPGSTTTIWIMNSGTEPATASYAALGEDEYAAEETIDIPAESIVGIDVEVGIGYYGYRISASLPVSVAWDIAGDRGVGLAPGIPLL